MIRQRRTHMRGITAMGCLLLAALHSGCQAVGTHHAYESYYEHDGMWCGDFAISFEGARVAALAALAELKMPIIREGPERHGIFIDTRTPDNFDARIVLMPPGRHADGTRIGVRVGGFGTHRHVCERLLSEIARHQDAIRHIYAMPALPAPPPPATPGSPPLTAAPAPTAASSQPSLPPEPVPVDRK